MVRKRESEIDFNEEEIEEDVRDELLEEAKREEKGLEKFIETEYGYSLEEWLGMSELEKTLEEGGLGNEFKYTLYRQEKEE